MEVTFLGKKKINFENERGEQISGTTVFFAFPEDGIDGLMAGKAFLRGSIEIPAVKSGEQVDLTFNNRGKVTAMRKK